MNAVTGDQLSCFSDIHLDDVELVSIKRQKFDTIKDLSTKLFEWTNQRWIISFSKIKGELSVKDKEKNKQIEIMENSKKTDLYKSMLDNFSDAELIDVKDNKNNEL